VTRQRHSLNCFCGFGSDLRSFECFAGKEGVPVGGCIQLACGEDDWPAAGAALEFEGDDGNIAACLFSVRINIAYMFAPCGTYDSVMSHVFLERTGACNVFPERAASSSFVGTGDLTSTPLCRPTTLAQSLLKTPRRPRRTCVRIPCGEVCCAAALCNVRAQVHNCRALLFAETAR
jgi:hypothetical protein